MRVQRSKLEQRGYELSEDPFGYPGMVQRGFSHKSIRIWVYPSFEPFVSFTLAKFKEGYFARRMVWDQRKQVMTDEPQTYCAEIEVSDSVFQELAKSLAQINLSPFEPAEMLGIDGVRFGVTLEQFMSETTLHWWGCYPEAWNELRAWHGTYINKLNGLFPECSISIEQALTSGSIGRS